jgi:hypothetical protein
MLNVCACDGRQQNKLATMMMMEIFIT